SSTSASVSCGDAAGGVFIAYFTPAQPTPVLPWRNSPLRYATPSATSERSSLRRQSASAPTLARRLRVAATRPEAPSSSASSTRSGLEHRGDEERPRGEEGEPPDRRRRPDPALGRDREDVEAPGEEHDAGEHQPARGPEQRGIGKLDRDDAHREQAEGVEDVVLDSGMPHGEHLGRNPALERVGAKGAERDREERGDAAEREKEPDRGRQGCHDKILAAMAKIVIPGIDRLKQSP